MYTSIKCLLQLQLALENQPSAMQWLFAFSQGSHDENAEIGNET